MTEWSVAFAIPVALCRVAVLPGK